MGLSESIGILGGVGGIVGGISAWLAKVWAQRISDREVASYNQQIELLKTSLESIKQHNAKYTSAQFESYSSLWSALIDLKINGDKLWDKASAENLIAFNKSRDKASELIQKSRIFLEDQHYQQFLEIMCAFDDYHSGKLKLFQIRSKGDLQNKPIHQLKDEIHQIEINSFFRNAYTNLLNQIADSLKVQLGLKEAVLDT